LHQEITQPLSLTLLQRKKKNQQQAKQLHEEPPRKNNPPSSASPLKIQITLLPPGFQPLLAWLSAQAFPCTVTSSSPQIHKMVAFLKSVFPTGLISQTLKPKRSNFQTQ